MLIKKRNLTTKSDPNLANNPSQIIYIQSHQAVHPEIKPRRAATSMSC